jgi:hypothetical protein
MDAELEGDAPIKEKPAPDQADSALYSKTPDIEAEGRSAPIVNGSHFEITNFLSNR